MQHREFTIVTATPTSLHAQSWTPSGRSKGVIVIVHGLGEHSGRYHEAARRLAEAGYYVFAADQIGHGRSPGKRGDSPGFESLLDDVESQIAEAARGADTGPTFLYAHSLGGAIALNLILRREPPVQGAVIASPLLLPTTDPPRWKRALAENLCRTWPSCTLPTGIQPRWLSRDEDALRERRADPLVHTRVSARLGVQMLAAGQWAFDNAEQLRIPVLMMHGSADKVTSPEACREFAQRAERFCALRIWDGLYHELHWEKERAEIGDFVLEWLKEH